MSQPVWRTASLLIYVHKAQLWGYEPHSHLCCCCCRRHWYCRPTKLHIFAFNGRHLYWGHDLVRRYPECSRDIAYGWSWGELRIPLWEYAYGPTKYPGKNSLIVIGFAIGVFFSFWVWCMLYVMCQYVLSFPPDTMLQVAWVSSLWHVIPFYLYLQCLLSISKFNQSITDHMCVTLVAMWI